VAPVQLVAACLAVLAAGLAGLVASGRRSRRRVTRHLAEVTARLDPDTTASPAAGDLPAQLARLDRAVAGATAASARRQLLTASLRRALDAVPLGVVVADEQGRVVVRNAAATALLRGRGGEALASEAVSGLLRSAPSGGPATRTLDLYGPPRRTLTLTAHSLDEAGPVVAVVIEDVSERRRLDAVRRDFVANVSHELKTPIAAVGLLAETLVAEDDAQVVRRLAERLQAEAFRVATIIEDLLDLSRLEAEETPRHEPVAVVDVVAQAVAQAGPAAMQRGVTLSPEDMPRHWTVPGDRRQLVSALANLLENAVKYSEPGSMVEVVGRTDGATIEVAVHDHGIGIPSRDLDRIFERFYRVDRGRGRDTGGTGLGLSIVRHVVGNHGGDVRVESREGQGSVFTLRLPAGPGPVGLPAQAAS
jgi:two-component system sensor histidine kinase SenX3